MNLRQTFSLAMASLVLMAQCATVALALYFAADQAERGARENLRIANVVAESFLEIRKSQLANSVSVLAKDFALRSAAATNDMPTIRSALGNHAKRIDAHNAMYLNTDGVVEASIGTPLSIDEKVWRQATAMPDSLIVLHDTAGAAYQVELAPIRAPQLIGWVTIGFRLDEDLTAQLERLTGTRVAFVEPAIDGAWHVDQDQTQAGYVLRSEVDTTGMELLLELSLTRAEALADFFDFRNTALVVSSLALLFALAVSFMLGRGLTDHLERLALFARNIAGGDYKAAVPSFRSAMVAEEVAQFSRTLEHMQEAISEREGEILHRATHDSQTGLLNQDAALKALQNALEHARGDIIIAVVAVRGVQQVNASFGLHMGELTLARFASALNTFNAELVARLSDSRFLFVMATDSSEAAAQRLRHMVDELEIVQVNDDLRVKLDASVGVCKAARGAVARICVRDAWTASVKAESSVEALVWHEVDDSDQFERRLAISRDLKPGLEAGQLYLVYQPKLDIVSGHIHGAEALLRWQHPELGFVPVDEFVALAEQSRDIRAVTRWVLGEAAAQVKSWRRQYPEFQMAVNVTAHDLTDQGFAAFVAQLLAQHKIPGAALQLEVTENAVVQDWAQTRDTLTMLEAIGVAIAIDDFGTGYSSLSHMKQLPASILKIDKSFVMQLGQSEEDQHIVRSTVRLAHDLGLQVVAEGVEDEQSLRLLREWGCDFAQGYHLSKPVSADELEAFVADYPGNGDLSSFAI